MSLLETKSLTRIYGGLHAVDCVDFSLDAGEVHALIGPNGAGKSTALDRVGLADRAGQIAGDLSYGHQRLLEIAMGVAQAPRLLILDEPTQGLAESEIAGFNALIKGLAGETTILLIEHNMNVVMALADRITVLEAGQVLASGTPNEIRTNVDVQNAYLGTS